MELSHYQKTYITVLTELLQGIKVLGINYKTIEDEFKTIENQFWSYAMLEDKFIVKFCKLLKAKLCFENTEAITSAIKEANEITQKRILAAPYRIVSDKKEAFAYFEEFLHDEKKDTVFFSKDSNGEAEEYFFVKFHYNDNIVLIYGSCNNKLSGRCPVPNLEFQGIYDYRNKNYYELQGNLKHFYSGIDLDYSPMARIKQEFTWKIQQAVANKIILCNPNPIKGIKLSNSILISIENSQDSIFNGPDPANFSRKINIERSFVTDLDCIKYIDNPETAVEEKAERFIKQEGSEALSRFWVVHCVEQLLYDKTRIRTIETIKTREEYLNV